ncbi:hypothetical protein DB346_15530 [Verrucomicrobia bacterium LW23]|nr:hypothetical protein DB346_15530 [Verrucomicrobia bacterium LW23]
MLAPTAPALAAGDSLQDQYLKIYLNIQEADKLEAQGQKASALRKYQDSYAQLDSLAKANPQWEKAIVQYRLKYVRGKMSGLRGARDASPAAERTASTTPARTGTARTAAAAPSRPAPAPEPEEQTEVYSYKQSGGMSAGSYSRKHSGFIVSRNTGTPYTKGGGAAAGSSSLRQQINDLQATVADLRAKLGSAVTESQDLRRKLAFTTRQLAEAKAKRTDANMSALLAENASLKEKLATAEGQIRDLTSGNGDPNSSNVAQLQAQLKTMQAQLKASEESNEEFRKQNAELQTQLADARQRLAESEQRVATSGAGASPDMVRENETLRGIVQRQLQEQARRDLAARLARDEMKRLKVDSDVLKQQVDILASPLVALSDEELSLFRKPGTPVAPVNSGNQLSHQISPTKTAPGKTTSAPAGTPMIDTAPAPLSDKPVLANSGTPKSTATQPSPATDPTKIEYVQATPGDAAPTTAGAPGKPAGTADGAGADGDLSKTARVPEGARGLAQEATDLFNRKRFDEASAKYQQIIDAYPDSLYAWSNLGVVRFQQQNFPEAQRALQQAVKLNPNDDFSHSVLGIVYYQSGRFDDAVASLTRAAALNPNNAQTRNYLGIACSQKGWQEAAESECKKAIALDPNYGDAHFNLAVIYASQKPANKDAARKHYQIAVGLGVPKDVKLEKMLQ